MGGIRGGRPPLRLDPRIPTDPPFYYFLVVCFFCCRPPVDRGGGAERRGETYIPPIPLRRCSARDARHVAWQPPRATGRLDLVGAQ